MCCIERGPSQFCEMLAMVTNCITDFRGWSCDTLSKVSNHSEGILMSPLKSNFGTLSFHNILVDTWKLITVWTLTFGIQKYITWSKGVIDVLLKCMCV